MLHKVNIESSNMNCYTVWSHTDKEHNVVVAEQDICDYISDDSYFREMHRVNDDSSSAESDEIIDVCSPQPKSKDSTMQSQAKMILNTLRSSKASSSPPSRPMLTRRAAKALASSSSTPTRTILTRRAAKKSWAAHLSVSAPRRFPSPSLSDHSEKPSPSTRTSTRRKEEVKKPKNKTQSNHASSRTSSNRQITKPSQPRSDAASIWSYDFRTVLSAQHPDLAEEILRSFEVEHQQDLGRLMQREVQQKEVCAKYSELEKRQSTLLDELRQITEALSSKRKQELDMLKKMDCLRYKLQQAAADLCARHDLHLDQVPSFHDIRMVIDIDEDTIGEVSKCKRRKA